MKKNLLLLSLSLFFLSAYGELTTTSEKENMRTPFTANYVNEIVGNNNAFEGIEDSIAAYCKKGTLQNFLMAKTWMDTCSSDYSLAFLYRFVHDSLIPAVNEGITVSHPEVIYSADDRPMQTWSELPNWFPLIAVDLLCSECSVDAIVNIAPFIKLAIKTKGKRDDAYFDLLRQMYFSENFSDSIIYEMGGNISNWRTMDGCDFCSYSELGGGAILKMYQLRDNANASGNLFKEEIMRYSGCFQPDAFDNHYGYSKEEVIGEINKIQKTIKLTDDERKALELTLQKVKAGTGIQFNCKNEGCTYDM